VSGCGDAALIRRVFVCTTGRQRLLGGLMIAAGLLLILWPAAIWLLGIYSQWVLAERFARAEVAVKASATSPADSLADGTTRAVETSFALPPAPFSGSPIQPKPLSRPKTTHSRTPQPRVSEGDIFARLRIDRIGLDAIVVEGTATSDLRRGPGHIPGTGLPGGPGNCAIAAHRARWFRRLPDVKPGDIVSLETPTYRYRYVVEEKRLVTPDRGDLLNRGSRPQLTLITCDAPTSDAARRVLVFCRLGATLPR